MRLDDGRRLPKLRFRQPAGIEVLLSVRNPADWIDGRRADHTRRCHTAVARRIRPCC